ncbi:TRAP transporter small permease [Roseicella frigidaeris]|uniref:TRAP transporter small permease protein n=1 Tax=Roseicella frigidaeris TaxID=2230885 RepID=A0A327M287_9PROT|nr:TRAP transporter small permease [Roseicella frigidaeris]RAI57391.1 TRAP transporter small permease [Roseicella frigidaeris]
MPGATIESGLLPPSASLPLRLARNALTLLRRAVDGILLLLLAAMILLVLAQVVCRYGFNRSIPGGDEAATFAQIWMVLLGAGYAMRQRLHVAIELVIERLPAGLARLLLVPVTGLCLWFLWVVFQGGLLLMQVGAWQTSPGLQIPMDMPYAMLPVGAAYFALEVVLAFGAAILGLEPVTSGGGVRVD